MKGKGVVMYFLVLYLFSLLLIKKQLGVTSLPSTLRDLS